METQYNNSLKQYYIDLKKLANNTLIILNGINEAFTSKMSSINININDSNGKSKTLYIPSFLYLENKLEDLENNLNSIINVPKNGEAWYTKESNMYKLNIISNTAPQKPVISYNNEFNITNNNFFKDLVNPKTYMVFNLDNLSTNISKVLVKKVVLLNDDLIKSIYDNSTIQTYSQYKELLYLMNEGSDYIEYEYEESLPLKEEKYESRFEILDITEIIEDNQTYYNILVDTLLYYDKNDNSLSYKLKVGDLLTIYNKGFNIFEISEINQYINDDGENEYSLKVYIKNGNVILKTINIDNDMYFTLYDNINSQKYNHIKISLEENPYIILFISTLYNNTKSDWSDAIKLNMNNIYIYDTIQNKNVSYIEYYNQYCKNIGDIIYSISDLSYNSLHSYTNNELKELTTGKVMQTLVTSTLYKNNNSVLEVSAINTHLIDDDLSSSLIQKHKEKIEINNELDNVNANINDVYNQLINTDFSTDVSISQEYLKSKLNTYYSQRLSLQQQFLTLVSNIDLIKNDVVGYDSLKYRIRGVTNAQEYNENGTKSEIIEYLKTTYGEKCDIIGLEVEYKYKNINSNSSVVKNNSDTIFTDWVRINNIDKQRYLKFDDTTGKYTIEFNNYDTNTNIIKWNQIDIPISASEDVIVRIRYKYNIGQPFINLYTPWSDEYTVSYTSNEIAETTDITQIFTQNANDIINAKFISELINGGYQDHITNKIIDNSQIYYHMPENIYSGFNTSDNKLISLKDQLQLMNKDIEAYKSYINDEVNAKHSVLLQIDDTLVELNKNSINEINIQNDSSINNTFTKKILNIVIKNTGENSIKLYSIFPGNSDIKLLDTNYSYYNDKIINYECVPGVYANVEDIKSSIYLQRLGQFIYFRENNIWTLKPYYRYYVNSFNEDYQKCLTPKSRVNSNSFTWNIATTNGIEYYNDDNDNNENTSDELLSNVILTYEHKLKDNNKEVDEDLTYLTDYNGMVLLPYLYSNKQITCENNNSNNQYKTIYVGESLSIPLLLEYFINNVENNSNNISKTISFDLKFSLLEELENYILKINIQ